MSSWGRWRPKTITPQLVEEIAGYVREGATLKIAARRAGVPPGILRRWMEAGEREIEGIYESAPEPGAKPERGYPSQLGLLYEAVAHALGERDASYLREIERAEGQGSQWRARAWLLEKQDPDDFGDRRAVEVSGARGGPIEVEGKPVAGLADVIALVVKLGYGDRYGLPAELAERGLPAARDVLPDPAESERAAGGALALPRP